MEYSPDALAKLAGVSTRTLRYYDTLGLLRPKRRASNGYRVYGAQEVDRLQQILFYRELGLELERIGALLDAPDFDRESALLGHLHSLIDRRAAIDALIATVERTLSAAKGEKEMSDKEKFEGFKKKLVEDNERTYGAEVRRKYGDDAADASNAKLLGMSPEQYERMQTLEAEIREGLKTAVAGGNPAGADAQAVCDKHRQWLCMTWKDGTYSKAAHRGLAAMYVEDPRFTAYYEQIAPGAAQFLKQAIDFYCAE